MQRPKRRGPQKPKLERKFSHKQKDHLSGWPFLFGIQRRFFLSPGQIKLFHNEKFCDENMVNNSPTEAHERLYFIG